MPTRTRWPLLTALVCVLALVGFGLQGADATLHFGAYSPALYAFELHRLITVNFVHLSLPHLINNVVFLAVIGAMAERRYPRWLWATLVFGGTAAGALGAALYWDMWLGRGLSGGVCALTAFLLATEPAPFRLKALPVLALALAVPLLCAQLASAPWRPEWRAIHAHESNLQAGFA
jgi:membrane associated rhomboid family serine protease